MWRPLKGPVTAAPSAVLDAQTLQPDDLLPVELHLPDRIGKTYAPKYSTGGTGMEIEAIFSLLCKSLKHKVMISDGVQASCRRLIGLHCQFAWSDMLAATCAMFADP